MSECDASWKAMLEFSGAVMRQKEDKERENDKLLKLLVAMRHPHWMVKDRFPAWVVRLETNVGGDREVHLLWS